MYYLLLLLFSAVFINLWHKSVIAVHCRFVQKLTDLRQWWTIFEIPKNFTLILWYEIPYTFESYFLACFWQSQHVYAWRVLCVELLLQRLLGLVCENKIYFEVEEFHFCARQHICYSAYMPVRLSVCLTVCPSHGWFSQKRLKLGSCNFHHQVAPWL